MGDVRPWWMDAVVYQIYPRSLRDTSGTGVGDLNGVRAQLDHIAWLGFDALWLSPIYPSPMADHGYDVADYCDVEPLFGTLDDFDHLLAEAHERDLRVLLDWVPNHSSDAHPWFLASRSSRDDPRRDWYLWVDGTPDAPPNDWPAAFPAGAAWAWDEGTEAWYYHRYTPQQPDLNWANPEVVAAMHDTLRFWFDRGVDGFRMDVIHQIGKDMRRVTAGVGSPVDPARTHELLRGIRKVVDSYPGDRVAVGEVYILDVAEVTTYIGREAGELHLAFDFVPLWSDWTAATWREHLQEALTAHAAVDAWPTWVLGSHDIARLRTRLGRDESARAAVVLLLGLRGTAFVYAGDELGLEDAVVPPEQVEDPAGFRDGCRAPIPWEGPPSYGWTDTTPWLPWPPGADTRNAAALREDPSSILHLYRRMLAARRESPALHAGEMTLLPSDDDVLAWVRTASDGADRRVVAVNFADEPRAWELPAGEWTVEVASVGPEGERYGGELAPFQAVVLR
ncbi:MAG TPA: alpha-amylase family glycosyl hydrolase [Acidimicrobiales bacterium]|nr:alpha-amylase family glycosyl hydrolase [Acidimicrobiales bacterium]